MFEVDFSSSAKKFLKKAEKYVTKRIINEIEKLRADPFPKDVKRVVNRKEKVFRVRVGDYRIQYSVFYDKNLLFVSDVDNRSKAYD
mgnify:CR=1 FL=1